MPDAKEELRGKLGAMTWETPEEYLDPAVSWAFIGAILGEEPVRFYYVSQNPPAATSEYQDAKLHVMVCTDKLFYDFILSDNLQRYDVSPIDIVYRIEERREQEASVDGASRQKTVATIDFMSGGTWLKAVVIDYGTGGIDLRDFIRQLRSAAFGSPP